MECNIVSTAVKSSLTRCNVIRVGAFQLWKLQRLGKVNQVSIGGVHLSSASLRVICTRVSLEDFSAVQSKDFSQDEESDSEPLSEETLGPRLSGDELKAILADSERSKLIKKLSDANGQIRFLKRQLQVNDSELVDFKNKLAVMEVEIQDLVSLAKEVANYRIPDGSRKIKGKYIQSHLHSRLGAVQEKLKEQIKGVDAAQPQEVQLYWYGVAESVEVMGSFDGWNQGENLSPEYTGSYAMFSTILRLRPGRYEIKFLVDGEWQLSPEYPTVGEGSMQNNLLILE